jgi:cyclic pyranopterin phosphate synthase
MPRKVFGSGFPFLASEALCSVAETTRLCRLFSELGVRKVRITGGEPLLRRNIEQLVAAIASLPNINDVALTTNGVLLAGKASKLREAGLGRVTVSLDALDEAAFRSMSDTRLPLARVLEGIDAARDAGLAPVKINMVVRRGVNERCVPEMAEHFRGRPEILRFIEYMDVGNTNGWEATEVVPASEILQVIDRRWPLESLAPTSAGEVASRYRYSDGAGEIGVIHSVSQPFCSSCTRARLSADGTLFTCLFASSGVDLRELLRNGASDEEIRARLVDVWQTREDRYSAERAELSATRRESNHPKVEMSYIGG